jgi:Na+-transporting methylmalonyl-CoA/oxaloacetate decarboxylase gamma subunit
MVEVIIVIWLTCFILSSALVTWNYFSTIQKLKSKSLINLNANLKKIDMYWSVSNENFEKLEMDSVQKDKAQALRSSLFLGFLGLASVIGFLLLLAIVLSLRFLIKERRTIAVFKSELTKNSELSKDQVENLYLEFSKI